VADAAVTLEAAAEEAPTRASAAEAPATGMTAAAEDDASSTHSAQDDASSTHSGESSDEEGSGKMSPQMKALASVWERQVEAAAQDSRANPFSQAFDGGAARPRKGDAEYGRARKGSLTEARAAAALAWVEEEIRKLVGVIVEHGAIDEHGRRTITFGELFGLYASISDTLVGILMRARKRRQLSFEADMLFQGVHDEVAITLLSEAMPLA